MLNTLQFFGSHFISSMIYDSSLCKEIYCCRQLLHLSVNMISDELKQDDFQNAPSLIFLNMSHNELAQVQGGAFRSLQNLKYLDLSFNRVQRLNSDSFIGLDTVEELDLSFNFLTQIPVNSLKILSSLRVLKLSGNLLQNLEMTKDMKSLTNLEVLDLSRNRLSELPRDIFQGMSNLKELHLGVNQLRTLPSTAFDGLTGLISLNLIDNNLLAFPNQAVENITHLQSLNLDYNRISALTPMKNQNLTRLSISHNLIREIPPDTFTKFPLLTQLNLRGNLIETLDEVLLPITLQELDIGFNSIRSIPRFQLPALESLKLDHNQVSTLLQHNFVLLGNLRELDLSYNMISSFFGNSFDGLDSLETLDLAGNKLEYIPQFGNMYSIETLNFSKNLVKEIGLLENMLSLTTLDLSHNQISNMKTDTFFNTSNLITIKLQHNRMNSFKGFTGSFDRLKTLDLSNNHISYAYPNSFESFGQLWNLNLNNNRFTLFPTEFLKPCKQLRYVGLAKNQIKNLNEMNFSNFAHLRQLDLSGNLIEFVIQNAFLNSTQLQVVNLAGNKLENLDANVFHGIIRLELDISNNYMSTLPPTIFDRTHVQKLHKLSIAKNAFQSIPHEALQRQYFYLEDLDLSENRITEVPQNLNILVNVKNLDMSYNPLGELSLKNILSEPKTVRSLHLANCSVKSIPVLEMPFLRNLNLSYNEIKGFEETVFQRTTLLESLDLSWNQFYTLESSFPASLKNLDLTGNFMNIISGTHVFPLGLESLKLNSLENLMKVEKTALNLKNMKTLELYNLPKLGYLDIRGLLAQLHYLENFDFEVKDYQIADQIHPGLNARVKRIGLRGRRVRAISTGAFAGLTSPEVEITLANTSLTMLPSILVPVPMSSNIVLDVSDSKITNLSPPFLTQNIKLQGLSPVCDCNAVNLVKYLQTVESSVLCSGPTNLLGHNVLDIRLDELTCEPGSSTTPPPVVSTVSTTTTTFDDIIWSVAPTTGKTTNNINNIKKADRPRGGASSDGSHVSKVKPQEYNNMDSLIFGIVAGVIILIVIFVVIIICFVKMTNSSGSELVGPATLASSGYPQVAPSVVSVGPGGAKCTCPHKSEPHSLMVPHHHQSSYATLRSNSNKYHLSPQQAAAMMHQHAKYSTMSPMSLMGGGGGSIYAVHPGLAGANGSASLSMYPTNTMTMTAHQPNSLYNANPTYGGSYVGSPRVQQQSSIYGSMPYYSHQESEYDTRR